jgi:fosfomycin resistance protein FosX
MQIENISHITFIVKDLQRTSRLFCEALGAKEVYDSKQKNFSIAREKFFLLGGAWIVAMEGDPLNERTYQHLAFKVSPSDLMGFEKKLLEMNIDILPPRPRVEGEG